MSSVEAQEVIRKVGDEWCLFSKTTGEKLGCHPTREEAVAQERAIQAHKAEGEQTEVARDPAAVCGALWFRGTPAQRAAFGGGTGGRGRDEKPPKAWMDDCLSKIEAVREGEEPPSDETQEGDRNGTRDFLERQSFSAGNKVHVRREGGRLVEAWVENVKVLGPRSVNTNPDGTHNVYTKEARARAVREGVYEGVAVNIDHPPAEKPSMERSYGDRFGWLEGVHDTPDGLVARKQHVNPKHALAEQFVWDAQNRPQNVGLSHNARGDGTVKGQECLIEHIKTVRSVDVVSAGATTRTLFEGQREVNVAGETQEAFEEPVRKAVEALTALLETPDDPEGMAKAMEIADTLKAELGAEEPKEEPMAEEGKKPCDCGKAIEGLREKVETLTLERDTERRHRKRESELREARIPAKVGEIWLENLLAEENDERAKKMIEERRALLFHREPTSRDPAGSGKPLTADNLLADLQASRRR